VRMQGEAWRTQAFWRVGDEEKSYRPIFSSSANEAHVVADEMCETLAHFGDSLRVVVVPATSEEVETEQRRRLEQAQRPHPLVHLMVGTSSEGACGETGNVVHLDLWHLTGTERRCSICDGVASRASIDGGT
jgi:hypothetical protein